MKITLKYGCAVLCLVIGCTPPVKQPTVPQGSHWLNQGWNEAERVKFHYTSEGSASFPIPYEWFVALEQPSATPATESSLFIAPDYSDQFGFIRGKMDAKLNPKGLPVGFARTDPFNNPIPGALNPNPANGKPYTGIGITCAACHTGQLTYKGAQLLIDGGPAVISLGKYREAVQQAIGGLADPERLKRFMGRVLQTPTPSKAQSDGLLAQIGGFRKAAEAEFKAEMAAAQKRHAAGDSAVVEGFTRLDATARAGNQIFWTQQRRANPGAALDQNYSLTTAPVNFPPVWNASWFDWMQYNGSVRQAMFRDFSQAVAGGAILNLGPDPKVQLHSTVLIENLFELQTAIAGPPPFKNKKFEGLRSPAWPEDILGKIDTGLAAKGKALYAVNCQRCHLPAPDTEEFWAEQYWRQDPVHKHAKGYEGGKRYAKDAQTPRYRYLKLNLIPIDVIGTDPAHAETLLKRRIQMPAVLGGEVVLYSSALASLEKPIEKAYDLAKVPPGERAKLDGYRPHELRAEMAYRPRPLNGMWATPPFLHNASVPSLYQLLSPVAERPKKFFLGGREFDPKHIGIDDSAGEGRFELDTSLPGNLNTGHEFSEGTGKGVIGPKLSPEERLALIEYIKTL